MRVFFIFVFFFALETHAAPKERPSNVEPSRPKEESPSSSQIWLAPPTSLIVGFGMGHALQNRLEGMALAYPALDALGFLLIAFSMGDCKSGCQSTKDTLHHLGLGTLIVSRIVQVVDVTAWSFKNGGKVGIILNPGSDMRAAALFEIPF